ncbi:MAG: hypothetical protein FWF23_03820 [Alphaproteobacteria bacterium]|nr:hypothetical protein [Alphaproteobacteria bacterium]MCL2505470.1 hypothetical protein [Alphaproteobacteria bacterium]
MANLQNKLPMKTVPKKGVQKAVQKHSGGQAGSPLMKKVSQVPMEFYQQNISVLPPASIVYSIGAAFLFVYSIYLLLLNFFLAGFLVFFMSACLIGFAWQMFKRG